MCEVAIGVEAILELLAFSWLLLELTVSILGFMLLFSKLGGEVCDLSSFGVELFFHFVQMGGTHLFGRVVSALAVTGVPWRVSPWSTDLA